MGAPVPLPYPSSLGDVEPGGFEDRTQRNMDTLAIAVGNRAAETSAGTTFPTSPSEGQVFTYIADATNGVLWSFVYHATGSSYDWWFTGGAPLLGTVTTSQTRANAAYGDLATVGPAVVLPFAGDYMVTLGARIISPSGELGFMSYAIGASAAADTEALWVGGSASTGGQSSAKSESETEPH